MRSPAIAIACAIVNAESTVMILPFLRMRSAGAARACATADEPEAAAAVAAPARKLRRVLLVMIATPNARCEGADENNPNWPLKSRAQHVPLEMACASPYRGTPSGRSSCSKRLGWEVTVQRKR